MQDRELQEIKDSFAKLQSEVTELKGVVYKNNFTSSQLFNKDCTFTSALKVPSYSSAPTVAEVGYLIEILGVLYICTDSSGPTWTVVGTQT